MVSSSKRTLTKTSCLSAQHVQAEQGFMGEKEEVALRVEEDWFRSRVLSACWVAWASQSTSLYPSSSVEWSDISHQAPRLWNGLLHVVMDLKD